LKNYELLRHFILTFYEFQLARFSAHLDELKKSLQVIVEDSFLQRRLERVRRSVDRLRDATVILEDTAGHSAERRRFLSGRPAPTIKQ